MQIFDAKDKIAIGKALAACDRCKEFTNALRAVGLPNEKLEEENTFNRNVFTRAKEFAEQLANSGGE